MRLLEQTKNKTNLIGLVFFTLIEPVTASELPSSLLGVWQVNAVHINMGSSRRTSYQLDDPRLRWRLFTISPDKIANDTPEASVCKGPETSVRKITISDLIGRSMAGYGFPPQLSRSEDYGMKTSSTRIVELISIFCHWEFWKGGLGAGTGPRAAWTFFCSDRALVLRWYDETILILEKLVDNAKSRPSFTCSSKNSRTEREICASISLGSFDRSVSDAYQQLKAQKQWIPAGAKRLILSQKQWLLKRNSCGSNSGCITNALRKRLSELMSAVQT